MARFAVKESDFAVDFDCAKQYETNMRQADKLLSRPLCLLDVEDEANAPEDEESDLERFSVHTSLKLPGEKATVLHVASTCRPKRSSHRVPFYSSLSDLAPAATPVAVAPKSGAFQSLKQTASAAAAFVMASSTPPALFTFVSPPSSLEDRQLAASLTINDCLILSDQELQFRVDHERNASNQQRLFGQPIDYEIELVVPVEREEASTTGRDMKRSKPIKPAVRQTHNAFSFSFKMQNLTRVSCCSLLYIVSSFREKNESFG